MSESTWFADVRFVPLTDHEQRSGVLLAPVIYADRLRYWSDDPVAHFLITVPLETSPSDIIHIELVAAPIAPSTGDAAPTPLAARDVTPIETPKCSILLDIRGLDPSSYRLAAALLDERGDPVLDSNGSPTAAAYDFEKIDLSHEVVEFPDQGIPVLVGEQSALARATWPVSTGVAFPQGALTDIGLLALFEDGEQVPAQLVKRATWHPESDALPSSVKWIGLDFLAEYQAGRPRDYRLRLVPDPASQPAGHRRPELRVTESDTEIIVDTGALKFVVNRQRFAGIEQAWFDPAGRGAYHEEETIIQGLGGPYVVDQSGVEFAASNDSTSPVLVEADGPVRATILADGWYTSAASNQLCRFTTRISAYAGEAMIAISHQTTITYDTTGEAGIRDAGWRIVPTGTTRWQTGADGEVFSDSVRTGSTVYVHQDRSDHVRLVSNDGSERVIAERRHSDGWLDVEGGRAALTIVLRDIYQKFPKEMELDSSTTPAFVNVHSWPKHGHVTFIDEEEVAPETIYKLRYAHQGNQLDFRLPRLYVDVLTQLNETSSDRDPYYGQWDGGSDEDGLLDRAKEIGARGVAISNDFVVLVHSSGVPVAELQAQASLFQLDPHALPDPDWNVGTGVEVGLSVRDATRFPQVERALDIALPGYMDGVVEQGGEHGMWIYADVHDSWFPEKAAASLHRVWSASHYRNVWHGWLLYMRSGAGPILRWARVNTNHYMDVGTLNAANTDDPGSGGDPAGGMKHTGFTPWSAQSDTAAHWINPDALLLCHYLTGSARAWNLYIQWATGLGVGPAGLGRVGYGRENNGTLGELVTYYRATWDPQALMYLGEMGDTLLAQQAGPLGELAIYHRQWFMRYYDLRRDERVVSYIREALSSGAPGFGDYTDSAFAFYHAILPNGSRDSRYLTAVMGEFYDTALFYYDDEGDRYHGYGRSVLAVDSGRWIQQAPYFLQAVVDSELDLASGDRPVTYPGSPFLGDVQCDERDFEPATRLPSLTVLVLEPDSDPGFTVRLRPLQGFGDFGGGRCDVFAPSGTRIDGLCYPNVIVADSLDIVVPGGDGEVGVYRIETRSKELKFLAPFTDLPEVGVIRKNDRFRNPGVQFPDRVMAHGRQSWYFRPVASDAAIQLDISALPGLPDGVRSPQPVYVRIEDAAGTVVVESTLFAYGRRRAASVILDPARQPLPWRIYTASTYGPWITLVDGADEIYIASHAAHLDMV